MMCQEDLFAGLFTLKRAFSSFDADPTLVKKGSSTVWWAARKWKNIKHGQQEESRRANLLRSRPDLFLSVSLYLGKLPNDDKPINLHH